MKMMRTFAAMFLVATLAMLPALTARAQPPQEDEAVALQKITERVRAGELTMEKAFEDGRLTRPVLLAIISTDKVLDAGRSLWEPGEESYRWIGFTIAKHPEILDDQIFLGYPARIRIAAYFFSKDDPRGAQIMEKILTEVSRENPDDPVFMSALNRLSGYYIGKGEYEKATETALKVLEFKTDPANQANILISAARAAWAGGHKEDSKNIYKKIGAIGYGWATGHANSDMANHLMEEGKLEEARALMKEPLTGLNGDQFRVIMNLQLARSYFKTGEWDEARKWAQASVQQYEALGNPIKDHGIEYYYEDAKRLPEEIDRAQKSPVELLTKQINVRMAKNATEPVRTFFYVKSYRAVTPKITADDPTIKTWLFREPFSYGRNEQKMIGVEIGPQILQRDGKAELTVSFEEFPNTIFHIPVTVKVTNEEKP